MSQVTSVLGSASSPRSQVRVIAALCQRENAFLDCCFAIAESTRSARGRGFYYGRDSRSHYRLYEPPLFRPSEVVVVHCSERQPDPRLSAWRHSSRERSPFIPILEKSFAMPPWGRVLKLMWLCGSIIPGATISAQTTGGERMFGTVCADTRDQTALSIK